MSSLPHLQVFHPDTSTRGGEPIFHLFPQLPIELRRKVWRHALERQRIIEVELSGPLESIEISNTTNPNHKLGRFCVYVNGYQITSKYLRTTKESREAALEFYRVHIPCQLATNPEHDRYMFREETKPGTLYFNPEYDILHIHVLVVAPNQPTDHNDFLLDFLQDLKTTYDPRHVGLLNLAVDPDDLSHYQWSGLDAGGKLAFLETIAQLVEVIFVHKNRFGRTNFGALSGVDTNEFFFNRSLPIMPLTPSFERLSRDPRPITQDLKKVHLNSEDMRSAPVLWARLLRQWGVSETKTKYTHLLAFVTSGSHQAVFDRKSATRWLETEDGYWKSSEIRKHKFNWPDEDLEKSVKSAFGFWLFPSDTFGPFGEEPQDLGRLPSLRDLSEHWPELALAILT
jgi:2EXR family